MYRRFNPWMAAGPQLSPGVFIGGLPTQETLPRFEKLHARFLGLMNLFYPERQTNATCNGCHAGDTPAAAVARDAGIGLHLWTNIRTHASNPPVLLAMHRSSLVLSSLLWSVHFVICKYMPELD